MTQPEKIALFEIVEIVDDERTRELEVAGSRGTVVGVSGPKAQGDLSSYAVSVDDLDRTIMFAAAELRPTGRRVARSDLYDGSSVRVSDRGEVESGGRKDD